MPATLEPVMGTTPLAQHRTVDFVLAGNAYFTALSARTGGRFTYRVARAKPDEGRANAPRVWFVSVLTGPDNTADYSYLGVIRAPKDRPDGPLALEHGAKSKIREIAPSFVAAAWLFRHVLSNRPLPNCSIYHEGRCGRCGRTLTVPESIESGFGPECIQHV